MSQTRRTFVAGAAAFSFAAGRAPAFAQQRLTPIRIVVTPVTNYTGLLVGRDKGWFEEQGAQRVLVASGANGDCR